MGTKFIYYYCSSGNMFPIVSTFMVLIFSDQPHCPPKCPLPSFLYEPPSPMSLCYFKHTPLLLSCIHPCLVILVLLRRAKHLSSFLLFIPLFCFSTDHRRVNSSMDTPLQADREPREIAQGAWSTYFDVDTWSGNFPGALLAVVQNDKNTNKKIKWTRTLSAKRFQSLL